jgi:hypothetical protein
VNGKKNTPQKETTNELAHICRVLGVMDRDSNKNMSRRCGMSDRKIDALRKAIMFQGSHPLHHRQVMARHRKEWPVLWKAIDQLLAAQKEMMNE